MAKKKETPPDSEPTPEPTAATPPQSLAKRLAARTGLGVGLISERLAAHNDDSAIESLLSENNIPEILQLLEPSNKA